jgi:hypothetical protein
MVEAGDPNRCRFDRRQHLQGSGSVEDEPECSVPAYKEIRSQVLVAA